MRNKSREQVAIVLLLSVYVLTFTFDPSIFHRKDPYRMSYVRSVLFLLIQRKQRVSSITSDKIEDEN